MMTINANTKIASILRAHAGALDAITSISPRFNKLRNPVLRKLMAGRTSLATASKFGGCSIEDFFSKLEPLGFAIDRTVHATEHQAARPSFLSTLSKEKITDLDVRPVLAMGTDPLNIIMGKIKVLQEGTALRIINTFEPTPLIMLLQKKGFECYSEKVQHNLFHTYFFKKEVKQVEKADRPMDKGDWDNLVKRFEGKTRTVDVRNLEMPQPMLTILAELDRLEQGLALYVFHKRIPVYLLSELADRGFDYRIREIADGEVHLLIFKL